MRREDGTLLLEGYAAREGVLRYVMPDGTIRRELVTRDTLLDSASTLARAPLTMRHPREDVTPDNVQTYGVGDVDGEVVVHDDGFTRVKMAVRRADAIQAVQTKQLEELSPGYKVRLDETPGTHPVDGPYDAVQVERVYNHLALVERARGGPSVRVRADSAVLAEPIDPAHPRRRGERGDTAPSTTRGGKVNPHLSALLLALGVTARVDSDDAGLALASERATALKQRADKLDATEAELTKLRSDMSDLEKEKEDMEKERDEAKAKADAAETKLGKLEADLKAKADAAELERLTALAGKLQIKADGLDRDGLRSAIAAKQLGADLPEGRSDAYVDALIDLAARDADKGRLDGGSGWAPTPTDTNNTGARSDAAEAQKRRDGFDRWSDAFTSGGDK